MAKSHFKEVSTSKVTIEDQPGQPAQVSSLAAAQIGTLSLGSGNTVTASAATASTHKITVVINGTTYHLLATTV